MKQPFRLDLGLRELIPEWRALASPAALKDDFVAGLTVASVAIPLSLAIALASGVAPAVGLVTAIVAGIVCALFGGTRLAVSGPAAAMAVLVASLVQEHGLATLLVVGIGCGLLQLFTGIFRLGRFVRLVPIPVVEGFTAGIGAIILIGQLPRALGLPPPEQSHVFDVVTHIGQLAHETHVPAVVLTIVTLVVIYGLPRLTRAVPSHLAGVVIASVVALAFGLDAETIGDIPRSLPAPRLPEMPDRASLGPLLGATFVVYALASLETLLSSAAVDKLAQGPKSDPDQELIGQGLGNLASALFGGIPITGVIARSATNVQAGAKTRRSAILHALALLATVFVFAPVIGRIPVAALAAVLFSVALRMLKPVAFMRLWRHSRSDAGVFAVTFAVIVLVGLLEGVQWGIVGALAIAAIRLGRTRMLVRGARIGEHYLFTLEGPLTFMSSLDVETLGHEIDVLERGRGVVLDVAHVSIIDSSGAEMLVGLIEHARARGLRPLVVGLDAAGRAQVTAAFPSGDLTHVLVESERTAATELGASGADMRLRVGVERYRSATLPRYAALFQQLARGQEPHTLFITCSDSRVQPNLITATEPGELFILRDIGNLVPPSGALTASAAGAAIEYAVGVLSVKKIIVCGHSECGAIKALLGDGASIAHLHNLEQWLDATEVRPMLRRLPSSLSPDEISKLNALAQVDHLATYPVVAEKVEAGELSITAWFFDVRTGEVEEYAPARGRFVSVGADEAPRAAPEEAPGPQVFGPPRPVRA